MTAAHEVVHEANHIVARPTPAAFFANKPSHLTSLKNRDEYEELYKLSVTNPDKFFDTQAGLLLSWDKPYEFVHSGDFKTDSNVWFFKGQLNASYNCLDKHAFTTPNKVALIYEADDEADNQTITYGQLLAEVCKVAAVLKSWGVQKGDRVAIYLPMIPAAVVAMLAVARLGAVHTVIFAGFSAGSVKDRVADAGCKVVITCNQGKRGGKLVHTKKIVDEGLLETGDLVQKVLVLQRTTNEVPFKEGRDFWWHEEIDKYPSYLPHTPVNSEDPLFMLYTSGSTGAPKGVVHSTAGYLLGAALSTKYVFDVHKEDILFTAGDVGWITGHTYAVYGPLVLGATSVIFESTPVYPDIGRYWRIIQRHKATHFYVAPTALRLIKQKGEAEIEKYDISSLRTLGSVGEPIAPELWHWYDEKIGHGKCHIADTYWQTESGAHLIAPMAGVPTKPGSASLPFFGIQPAIIDPVTGKELEGNDVAGVLAIKSPWPSMARTVYKNHRKYVETYLKPYPGYFFTGDSAGRDNDGYYWIRGRVDDVVNVSGHRLSTAEIEAALIDHTGVTEGAVVGIPDELTGQAIVAFVTMKEGLLSEEDADFKEKELALRTELRVKIRSEIGPFAAPKTVIVVKDLPKTRSGKIVRRILRKIISQEADQIGDTSTLVNPHSVKDIIASTVSQYLAAKI